MFTGLGSYLLCVAVLAVVLHATTRRFLAASLGGAVLGSVANLAYETYEAGGAVNLGWAPVLLVEAFVVALPVTLAVGWPFVFLRGRRRGDA